MDPPDRRDDTKALSNTEKRLKSLFDVAQQPAEDGDALFDLTLQEALQLTESPVGFICRYDEDQQVFELMAWSPDVMKSCQLRDPRRFLRLNETGLWGDTVRQRRPLLVNDFEAPNPRKRGYPAGHVPIRRFLSMPIFERQHIVAVVGVANKDTDYNDTDLMHLSLLMGAAWGIARRWEVETALAQSEMRAQAIYDGLPLPTYVWQRRKTGFFLLQCNSKAYDITQGGVSAWLGRPAEDLYGDQPDIIADLESAHAEGSSFAREMEYSFRTTGETRRLRVTYGAVPPDLVLVHTEDVTEMRRTEKQLKIAQRLDAIGKLAGGVAHDFNNLLSVIVSYTGFALDGLPESHPSRADLLQVREAGRQATELTRQLLAFGRRQIMEPKAFDLRQLLDGMETMLRRVIREDIDLRVKTGQGSGTVKADPGQMEQVILNLVVNARDAMPRGGRLTLEIQEVELDRAYADTHTGVQPGSHVCLAVSDTGHGMEPKTRERVFEPFFSTKEKEAGTGLGLAMVYGTIRQSGGSIWVYSEPGQGSTFKIYLPSSSEPPPSLEKPAEPVKARGSETMLIVEDTEAVRKLTKRMLGDAGYTVLEAANGQEALQLAGQHGMKLDLLLTDVIMPQMSGREVAQQLTRDLPGLKVIYMSGYPEEAILHHGVLEPGVCFLSKPFSASALTRRVRQALDEP